MCDKSGSILPLKLKKESYCSWSGNPTITVTHLIDEESPLYNKQTCMPDVNLCFNIGCSLTGTTDAGNFVGETIKYYPQDAALFAGWVAHDKMLSRHRIKN